MADDKRVDEIRARLEKATPGPWVYRDGEYNGDDNGFYPANDTEHVIGIYAPNNRDFIAHSRSDIEYLLSELASLRVQLDEAQKERDIAQCDLAAVMEITTGELGLGITVTPHPESGELQAKTWRNERAEAAEAENVRLRDALTKIAEDNPFASVRTIRHLREIARAALEGK